MTRVARPEEAAGEAPPSPEEAEAAATHAEAIAEDRRLATLHLRLGGLSLAWAELEDLNRRAELDTAGLAELAEARWRSGDLDAAAEAAAEHLAAGGTRPITRVIAAEAAAAGGRPVEARVHVEALGTVDADALDHLFSGMPRRAFWPSAPNAPVGLEGLATADLAGLLTSPAPGDEAGDDSGEIGDARRSVDGSPLMVGLWGDQEQEPVAAIPAVVRAADRAARRAGRPAAEPAEELARARDELGSGVAGEATRGLARLALVLRQDPTLATAVLDALGPRREVAALLLRGDAYRLLGRRLDAEAAFAAAARLLDVSETGRA